VLCAVTRLGSADLPSFNERKSREPSLVTAQSTAYETPEDIRMSGPKHVGVNLK